MQHTLIDPLVICGIISLTLQAVGFFSPARLIYSVRIDTEKLEASSGTNIGAHLDMDIDIHMGLWKTSACFDTGKGTECVSISTTKLEEKLSSMSSTTGNPAMKEVREEWIALQMLSVFAGISAIVGLVVFFAFARASEKALCHGVTVAVSWLLSAVLILAAVAKDANDIHTYSVGSDVVDRMKMGVNLKFELPWATIVSGLGGGFAAGVAIGMSLYLMCRDRREVPGVWRQLESGKPI